MDQLTICYLKSDFETALTITIASVVLPLLHATAWEAAHPIIAPQQTVERPQGATSFTFLLKPSCSFVPKLPRLCVSVRLPDGVVRPVFLGGSLRDAQEELGDVRGQRPVRRLLRGPGLGDRQAHRHQVQDLHRPRREVRRQGPRDEDLERDGRGAGVRGKNRLTDRKWLIPSAPLQQYSGAEMSFSWS